MKKILYISNSVEKLGKLPECELLSEELSSRLTPGIAEQSDLILIDQVDLLQAEQQLTDSIIVSLQYSRTPVLLLTHSPITTNYDSLKLVHSDLNGLVTHELLSDCFELLRNLQPVKQGTDWEVSLSLIEPFAQASSEVFEMTFAAKTHLLGIVTGRVLPPAAAISSSMTITGEIEGEAVVALSEAQARSLFVGILNCDRDELTDSDLSDGVNEVINQVSGRVRTKEWPEKYKFNIDLPRQVECGTSKYLPPTEAAWITLLIECYGELLSISIQARIVNKSVSLALTT